MGEGAARGGDCWELKAYSLEGEVRGVGERGGAGWGHGMVGGAGQVEQGGLGRASAGRRGRMGGESWELGTQSGGRGERSRAGAGRRVAVRAGWRRPGQNWVERATETHSCCTHT